MASRSLRHLASLVVLAAFGGTTYAASPFTVSGAKLDAIFRSELVWTKVFGAAESITFKGHDLATRTSTYTLKTTEPKRNSSGAFDSVACSFDVYVTATGDDLAPTWEVTNVDFAACPSLATP